MVKKIKHVVLNRRTPPPLCSSPFQGYSWMVATNDDPTIGTQENPYTLEEFNFLVLIGRWSFISYSMLFVLLLCSCMSGANRSGMDVEPPLYNGETSGTFSAELLRKSLAELNTKYARFVVTDTLESTFCFEVDTLASSSGTARLAMPIDENTYVGKIVLPDTVVYRNRAYALTDIYTAFRGQQKLTDVVLPHTVRSLSCSCFAECVSLEVIHLPANLEFVDCDVFVHCDRLRDIYIDALVPPVASRFTFMGFNVSKCTLHVPQGRKQKYRQADGWKDFGRIIEE